MHLFQLVKINPHRPCLPAFRRHLSVPSRSKRGMVLCISVSQSGECYCSHEFGSLCTGKESLRSSSSKVDTTENCFTSHSSKKSSVPGSPPNRCKSSEKATAKGFDVCSKTPSDVNVCGSSGSCHQDCRNCLQVCVVVFRHFLPARDSSDYTFHL